MSNPIKSYDELQVEYNKYMKLLSIMITHPDYHLGDELPLIMIIRRVELQLDSYNKVEVCSQPK